MLFNLHAIDLLLLLILAATAVSGWRRGFAVVTLGYAGLLVGLALGAWASARVGLFISAEDSLRRLLVGIVVFFLVAVVCHSLATRFGMQLRSTITGRVGGNVDAVGGAVVAVGVTAIALWFVALTLGSVPFSPLALPRRLRQPAAAGGRGSTAGRAGDRRRQARRRRHGPDREPGLRRVAVRQRLPGRA